MTMGKSSPEECLILRRPAWILHFAILLIAQSMVFDAHAQHSIPCGMNLNNGPLLFQINVDVDVSVRDCLLINSTEAGYCDQSLLTGDTSFLNISVVFDNCTSTCQHGHCITHSWNSSQACTTTDGKISCELDVDADSWRFCVQGMCIDLLSTAFCICNPDFSGSFCEQDKIEGACYSSPCLNGANCTVTADGYYCDCPPQYTGSTCEDLDACYSSPCLNGANCSVTAGGYYCDCPPQYTGPTCEDLDACYSSPCLNGANCNVTADGYYCDCPPQYTGSTCEDLDACYSSPCLNGANCSVTADGYYCDCPPQYTGPTCEVFYISCDTDPCGSGGECIQEPDSFKCSCFAGFTGTICETNIDDCPPSGTCIYGSCQDKIESYECLCIDGYSGEFCEFGAMVLLNNSPVEQNHTVTIVAVMQAAVPSLEFTVQLDHDVVQSRTLMADLSDPLPEWVPLNQVNMDNQTNHTYVCVVEHDYTGIGIYEVTATITDGQSGRNFVKTSELFVQEIFCPLPSVTISGGGPSRTEPVLIMPNQYVRLDAEIVSNCLPAETAVFEWLAYRMSSAGAVVSDANLITLSTMESGLKELIVQKYTLPLGLSLFQVKVTIPTEESCVINYGTAWVEIISAPIEAIISGGSNRTIGIQSEVVVDASSSRDLGVSPTAEQELTFQWFCISTWTPESLALPTQYMVNTSFFDYPAYEGAIQTCFHEMDLMLPHTQSGIQFRAINLKFDTLPAQFTFRVFVTKGEITSYADQYLVLNPGDPPIVEVNCFQNCGRYINPSEKLVIKSQCQNCEATESLSYKWSLVTSAHSSVQSLNWDQDTTTGRFSHNIVVKTGVFSSITTDTYEFFLHVTRLDGTEATVAYRFETNAAPLGGDCQIEPTDGVILETKFNVSCAGFTDPDMPLTYKIMARSGAASNDILLYYGQTEVTTGLRLPLGDKTNDYSLTVKVLVADEFGASTEVTKQVRVSEKLDLDIAELMATEDELNEILNSGDSQGASQFISTVTSVLNARAENEQVNSPTDLEEKDQRKTLRENMVQTLSGVTVQSMEGLQQKVSTLIDLTAVADELTELTQETAADSVLQMSIFLKDQLGEEESRKDLDETGKLLVSTVGNVMSSLRSRNVSMNASNTAEEIQKRKALTNTSFSALDIMKSTLMTGIVPGETLAPLVSDAFVLQLSKERTDQIAGREIAVQSNDISVPSSSFMVPKGVNFSSEVEEIGAEIIQFPESPYSWTEGSTSDLNSIVTDIVLRGEDGKVIPMSNTEKPFSIMIPHTGEPANNISALSLTPQSAGYLEFNMNLNDSTIVEMLSANVSVYPKGMTEAESDATLSFSVLHVMGFTENVNDTQDLYEQELIFLNSSLFSWREESNWTFCENVTEMETPISNWTGGTWTWQGTVRPQDHKGSGQYIIVVNTANTTASVDVAMLTVESRCKYWDTSSDLWSQENCQVGSHNTETRLNCECTHLTSFAGGFLVMPNKLNIKEDILMFLEFWKNPVGIAVIATTLGIYVMAMIWARRKDKLYQLKALPIDLMDNDYSNMHVYMLTIYTGTRRGAGTTASVTILINGSDGSSEPHMLECSGFPILQQNDVNSFLIRTPKSLGNIKSLRMWHHNDGKNPSWFVSRAFLRDLNESLEYYFLCNSWLSVDIGDCILDRTFDVATSKELKASGNLLLINTASGFSDAHLWFTALKRQSHSNFTCAQRVSGCLSLFMTFMLCNIMFYGVNPDPGEQKMDVGPFTITWTQIRIGLQSAIIMFPINMLVIALFRYAKPRTYLKQPWKNNLSLDEELVNLIKTEQPPNVDQPSKLPESCRSENIHDVVSAGSVRPVFSNSQHHEVSGINDQIPAEQSGVISFLNRGASEIIDTQNSKVPSKFSLFSIFSRSVPEHLASDQSFFDSEEKIETHGQTDPVETSSSQNVDEHDELLQKPVGERHSLFRLIMQKKTTQIAEMTEKKPKNKPEEQARKQKHEEKQSIHQKHSVNNIDAGKGKNTESILGEPVKDMGRDHTMRDVGEESVQGEVSLQDVLVEEPARNPNIEKSAFSDFNIMDNKDLDTSGEEIGLSNLKRSLSVLTVDIAEHQKKTCLLPWWVAIIAWLLVVLISLTCGFFTILYTFNYGPQRSIEWATSLILSFISDLLVQQPLRIIGISLFVSLVLKRPRDGAFQESDNFIVESEDKDTVKQDIQRWLRKDPVYRPPAQQFMLTAMQRKALEARVNAIAIEIVRYVIFLYLVLLLAYAQRDGNIYWQNKGIADLLVNVKDFKKITNVETFWQWAEDSLVDASYDTEYPKFLSNQVSYKLANPRLRQLRISKEHGCALVPHSAVRPCTWRYSSSAEDRNSYNGTWTAGVTENAGLYENVWKYQSPKEAGGVKMRGKFSTYSRGGFVADLRSNKTEAKLMVEYLKQAGWIDSSTAAVVMELAVYTANVNLLTLISISIEIPTVGGVWKKSNIKSMKMYRSTQGLHYFVLAFEVIYCCYTLFFIIYEVRRIRRSKKEYFRNAWNILELSAVITSLVVIGLYTAHAVSIKNAVKKFIGGESKQQLFYEVLQLDEALSYMFGLLVTIGMIKFLHLLRFNPLIHKFGHVLKAASYPLLGSCIILIIVFIGFGGFMSTIAGHGSGMFKNVKLAILSLSLSILGSFDYEELEEFHPVFGPLLFLFFLFTVVLIFFNLVIIALIAALEDVNQNPQPAEDAQLLWILVDKIKQWLGIGHKNPFLHEEFLAGSKSSTHQRKLQTIKTSKYQMKARKVFLRSVKEKQKLKKQEANKIQ